MRFHPLADMFPLIEGAEFDDLVRSIVENGQREPIITFEDAILDGRNRYRACEAAGVAPIMHPFTGRDPVCFVIDKNVHRRHLTGSQRAMIAAQFATLHPGNVAAQRVGAKDEKSGAGISAPPLSLAQAAELLNVNKSSVSDAKKVLAEGTEEEIQAVRDGRAAVSTIADGIRAKVPPEKRARDRERGLSAAGKNPERIHNMQLKAKLWGELREALNNLTNMPRAADVVAIARTLDRTGLVDARILDALEWLKDFADVWTGGQRDQDAA